MPFLSQSDCRFKYVICCIFVFVQNPSLDLEVLNGAQIRGMLPVSSMVSVANGEWNKGVLLCNQNCLTRDCYQRLGQVLTKMLHKNHCLFEQVK